MQCQVSIIFVFTFSIITVGRISRRHFLLFFSMRLMTAFSGRLAIWCASKFGWAMHVYGFSSASIDIKPLYTLCWSVHVKISFYQVPSDVFLAGNCTRSKEQPTHVGIYF
jgi:hypothetical protein